MKRKLVLSIGLLILTGAHQLAAISEAAVIAVTATSLGIGYAVARQVVRNNWDAISGLLKKSGMTEAELTDQLKNRVAQKLSFAARDFGEGSARFFEGLPRGVQSRMLSVDAIKSLRLAFQAQQLMTENSRTYISQPYIIKLKKWKDY